MDGLEDEVTDTRFDAVEFLLAQQKVGTIREATNLRPTPTHSP